MAGKDWTFQSLIDGKMTVTAYCHNSACYHSQKLDLAKLRDRFGPDAPAMERCQPDIHARHQPDRLRPNQGQLVAPRYAVSTAAAQRLALPVGLAAARRWAASAG